MTGRPTRVTLLQWLVLFLTAWNGLRLWTAIAWRSVLVEFAAQPAPVYAAVSGAAWMGAGSILLYGIWQRKPWATFLLLGVATGYTAWYWIERLAFQEQRPNWLFALILNLVLLAFIIFTSNSLTREAHKRSDNPT